METLIPCAVCGQHMASITWKHLVRHDLTLDQYKQKFPDSPIRSEASIARKKQGAVKANTGRKGISRSDQTKQKIRDSKKTNPKSAWNKGKCMSDQQKQQLSKTRKQKIDCGETQHWNSGNTTPQSVKDTISQTLTNHKQSEYTKNKRRHTYQLKKQQGWVHHSTKLKGIPSNISQSGRKKIRYLSIERNKQRKQISEDRIAQHLLARDIRLVCVDEDRYIYTLHCDICNLHFTRTKSVLAPYNYAKYDNRYCPSCHPVKLPGGYTEKFFNNHPGIAQQPGLFYLVVMFNNQEEFVKVGITSRDTDTRWRYFTVYGVDVILELNMNLYDAFRLEQYVLDCMLTKYTPMCSFGGETECFPVDQLQHVYDNIFGYINSHEIL